MTSMGTKARNILDQISAKYGISSPYSVDASFKPATVSQVQQQGLPASGGPGFTGPEGNADLPPVEPTKRETGYEKWQREHPYKGTIIPLNPKTLKTFYEENIAPSLKIVRSLEPQGLPPRQLGPYNPDTGVGYSDEELQRYLRNPNIQNIRLTEADKAKFERGDFQTGYSDDQMLNLVKAAGTGDPRAISALQYVSNSIAGAKTKSAVEAYEEGQANYDVLVARHENTEDDAIQLKALQDVAEGKTSEAPAVDPEADGTSVSFYKGSGFSGAGDEKLDGKIATNEAEAVLLGQYNYGQLKNNGIHWNSDGLGGITFYKTNPNGTRGELSTAEQTKAYEHYTNWEDARKLTHDLAIENAPGEKAIELQNLKDKQDRAAAQITLDWNTNQASLDRAIESGELEETIRANEERERLTSQQNEIENKQFAMTILMQIGANPSILFFLKQSGIVNQLTTMLGLSPDVFGGNEEGQFNPVSSYNAQSWAQLTPQQKKTALYSMQAQTGYSTQEILQQINAGAPGGGGQGPIRRAIAQ